MFIFVKWDGNLSQTKRYWFKPASPTNMQFLLKKTLKWTGQVHPVENTRTHKPILYSPPKEGFRILTGQNFDTRMLYNVTSKDKKIPVGGWQSLNGNRAK